MFVPESKRVPELLKEFQRQPDADGDRRGRVRRHGRAGDDRGSARGDRRRDPRRVRRRGGADRRRRRRPLRLQREGRHRRGASGSASTIEREGFETVGGYLLSQLGRVPAVGEAFEVDGLAVEVLEVERRRIHKVRMRRLPQPEPQATQYRCEGRLRLAHRPSQRRQVHAAQSPRRRRSSRSFPTSRRRRATGSSGCKHVPGRPDRVRRHARHPSSTAPDERADGRFRLDTIREVDVSCVGRGCLREAGQGRSLRARRRQEGAAFRSSWSSTRSIWSRSRVCFRSSSSYRREHDFEAIVPVSALTGDGVDVLEQALVAIPAGRGAALSGRLPDRSARAVLGGGDRPREAAAAHSRRAAVHDRGRRGSFEERSAKLLKLFVTILVERRVAEADRRGPTAAR